MLFIQSVESLVLSEPAFLLGNFANGSFPLEVLVRISILACLRVVFINAVCTLWLFVSSVARYLDSNF